MKQIKVIVAGTFRYDMYQEALSHGLELEGSQVIRLKLDEKRPYNRWIDIVNGNKLLSAVKENTPDVLFLYRVENLHPIFVKILKRDYPQLIIMQYHNDDPFRKGFKRFIKSYNYLHYIKYTDLTYVYRPVNLDEANSWGARNVGLYMSHYYSVRDFASYTKDDLRQKNNRVVYLGHFENDERVQYFDLLFKENIDFHIYGPEDWLSIFKEQGWPMNHLHDKVMGDDYRKIINQSSIALAFFSKRNRDVYTRRCFEIPICGTVILQPRTEITEKIFSDKINSLLFSSQQEFLEKIKYYLSHPDELHQIAWNGYQLIKNGDFSELARAKMVLHDYKQLKLSSQHNFQY